MLASYAVILRRSALATAPAAMAMIVLSGIVGGGKGLVGALLGVGLVIIFFGLSALAMTWATRRSPQVTMVTAITTYLVKILVLLFHGIDRRLGEFSGIGGAGMDRYRPERSAGAVDRHRLATRQGIFLVERPALGVLKRDPQFVEAARHGKPSSAKEPNPRYRSRRKETRKPGQPHEPG